MASGPSAFLIKGHQKVIDHYRWLLESHGQMDLAERDAILDRLSRAEAELEWLMNQSRNVSERQGAGILPKSRNR